MKPSKQYKPNSVYQDGAGTRYTILYKPEIKGYHMVQLNYANDRISNSGCVFTKWIRELKYTGELPEVNYNI